MATPYDAVIRVRKRESDEAANMLREAVDRLSALERERDAARAAIAMEINNAVADTTVRSDFYLLRMFALIENLAGPISQAETIVDERRDQLLQLLVETKALERVAESYRESRRQSIDSAEQSQVDDRVAFLHRTRIRAEREGRYP
jgi:flagellar export protein FliJ